jgi:archaellum biogenesis ATPase FlaH
VDFPEVIIPTQSQIPNFLKILTLDRFKSLSVIVSYSSDFIKICSVNHILIFSLDEPEVSSNTSTMFCKQRDELVLRKQAELNAIQRKSLSKTKIDGYEEALRRSFELKVHS